MCFLACRHGFRQCCVWVCMFSCVLCCALGASVFQDTSGGLMERLCWFKRITSFLRQNQLIICFTGTTRLTATLLTAPTNTTHTHTHQWWAAKQHYKMLSCEYGLDEKREGRAWRQNENASKTIRRGERYEVKRQSWMSGSDREGGRERWDAAGLSVINSSTL